MKNTGTARPISLLLEAAKSASTSLSGTLLRGLSASVWCAARPGDVNCTQDVISSTKSAMKQSADLIEGMTGTLSAIIEELDGVSDDPTSHVNVALGHARTLLEQLTEGRSAGLAQVVCAKPGDLVVVVNGYTVKRSDDTCHVYYEDGGDVYYGHIVDLQDSGNLCCPRGGPGFDRYHEVRDVDIDAIYEWLTLQSKKLSPDAFKPQLSKQ